MFSALSDRGSFGGVFFYLSDYELKSSFHNETLEFITDHLPETRLYKKAPREIPVSGFLCGDDAVLARDLLLRIASSPTPRTLFLPSLGFVSAICLSFSLSEKEQEGGAFALQFVFKEVPEKLSLPGGEILAAIETVNAIADDFALKVLAALQVLAVTAHGLRRITDAACKLAAMLHSVNGLGLVPAFLDTLQESFSQLEGLAKRPKLLLESIRRSFISLNSSQATKSILEANKLQILPVRHFMQLLLLEKIPAADRVAVFFQLVDELPTEESQRLLRLKTNLLVDDRKEETWKPSNSPLSLLCAFESGHLENESKIVHKNQSVFFCEQTL